MLIPCTMPGAGQWHEPVCNNMNQEPGHVSSGVFSSVRASSSFSHSFSFIFVLGYLFRPSGHSGVCSLTCRFHSGGMGGWNSGWERQTGTYCTASFSIVFDGYISSFISSTISSLYNLSSYSNLIIDFSMKPFLLLQNSNDIFIHIIHSIHSFAFLIFICFCGLFAFDMTLPVFHSSHRHF